MRAIFILAFAVLLAPVRANASDGVPADDQTTVSVAAVQKRPAVLVPLYAFNVALQGFDTYSTLTVIRARGVEQNAIVGGLVANPAAFIVVKSVVTVASIYAAERLWRQGHRAEAIAMLAVSNGLMTAVAFNNASVLRKIR